MAGSDFDADTSTISYRPADALKAGSLLDSFVNRQENKTTIGLNDLFIGDNVSDYNKFNGTNRQAMDQKSIISKALNRSTVKDFGDRKENYIERLDNAYRKEDLAEDATKELIDSINKNRDDAVIKELYSIAKEREQEYIANGISKDRASMLAENDVFDIVRGLRFEASSVLFKNAEINTARGKKMAQKLEDNINEELNAARNMDTEYRTIDAGESNNHNFGKILQDILSFTSESN